MMFEEDDEFSLSSLSSSSRKNNKKKKSSNNNKRRFTDDQIRSLESIFESETKLEPQKKMMLARELGLEPRQVAIWFQNKRARRKSKQLEHDYDVLLDSYTNLANQFDALKKENHSLITQVQKLQDMMMPKPEVKRCCSQSGDDDATREEEEDDKRRGGEKSEEEFGLRSKEKQVGFVSDEENSTRSIKAEYFGLDEEPQLMTMVEPADSSLTSPEDWVSLGRTDDLLDQSCSTTSHHQWWDFWS